MALAEIHANATSEKLAMGYYLDGRAAAVWGTHTHVQTADERVNPKGTGYITDIGMTGPIVSVLGVRVEQSIAMFRGDLTEYFKTAEGDCAVVRCAVRYYEKRKMQFCHPRVGALECEIKCTQMHSIALLIHDCAL